VSRSLSRWQAVGLGLVILVSLTLAGGGLFAIGSRGWFGKDALNLRAGFGSIRGVEVGTPVRIQGISAGEVVSLEPPARPGGPVVLNMRVRGDYRHLVRTNSRVQIVSEGLIGAKVIDIQPGKAGDGTDEPVADGALLVAETPAELTDLLGHVDHAVQGIQEGKGTLGKLANDTQLHDDVVAAVRKATEVLNKVDESMERLSDAVHRVPLVGGYVENPVGLLERPNCQRERRTFGSVDLFEPGRAVLTAQGRRHLDGIASWLEGTKHKGSEVVIVAYANPADSPAGQPARILTRQQSEAVADYLKAKHSIDWMGWLSSRRKVTPLGQGVSAPPVPERTPLPAARVEVIVFVPQA
jgi:phospholipid/cholesterol/gamma-HCH transport system substrate-binding protein